MSGYMIEISQEKQTEMSEHAEQILRHAGQLMQCLEEVCDPDSMGQRMGNRMGQRMGYRRGVKGTGRYGMRMGYREDNSEQSGEDLNYRDEGRSGMVGYRDPYYGTEY